MANKVKLKSTVSYQVGCQLKKILSHRNVNFVKMSSWKTEISPVLCRLFSYEIMPIISYMGRFLMLFSVIFIFSFEQNFLLNFTQFFNLFNLSFNSNWTLLSIFEIVAMSFFYFMSNINKINGIIKLLKWSINLRNG